MQYTVRNVPRQVDQALRKKAQTEGKSLNQVAVEALQRGLGLNGHERCYDDLDWFFGSSTLEPAVLKAIAEQDRVHPDDWK